MLKDNLKLLLLVIAIVQMPLVGFAMKPVKKQPATSSVSVNQQHEKSLFSVDQLKNINVLVKDMRNDAFNKNV